MASTTYVLADAYSTAGINGATVSYGNGQSFDILAALVSGGGDSKGRGGSFVVSNAQIQDALNRDPVVKVSGTGGGAVVTPISQPFSSFPPASAVPDGTIKVATDIGGGTDALTGAQQGTAFQSVSGQWVKASMGPSEGTRGALGSVRIGTNQSVVLAGSSIADIPGASVSFVYQGRPVRAQGRMPFSAYTVASGSLGLDLQDTGAFGGVVYRENITTPPTAGNLFVLELFSDPMIAFPDGTALVVGTTYTWKLRVRTTPAGTWSANYQANLGIYGYLAILEA